jgi:hypothetical protein
MHGHAPEGMGKGGMNDNGNENENGEMEGTLSLELGKWK